jgi:uncharacterized protein (TIGR02246 family)
MRKLVGTLCACLLLAAVPVWPQQKLSNVGGSAVDVENEKLIRKLYEEFVTHWNRHDVAALSEMWTIDGDQLEPDGTHTKGRPALTKLLMKQHTTVFKNTLLKLTIADVWFITSGVALVDGSYELSGVVAPDGTEIPTRAGHISAMLIHEKDTWQIAASRLMIPTGLPYKKSP